MPPVHEADGANVSPDLSILLISYRRPGEFLTTLADVTAQATDAAVEVVVVLQAYAAEDVARVRGALAAWPAGAPAGSRTVRVVEHDRGLGVHGARNVALRHARGRVVAFLDDDVRLEPTWAATLLPYFDDPAIGGVGGFVWHPGCDAASVRVLRPLLGMASRRYRVDWGGFHTMPYSAHPAEDQPADWLSGCNMAFRRAALDLLGGSVAAGADDPDGVPDAGPFVPTYGSYGYDDADVCVRLRRDGWRLLSSRRLAVRHYPSAVNRPPLPALVRAEEERRVAFVRRAIGDRPGWRARYAVRALLSVAAASIYGLRKGYPTLGGAVLAGGLAGLRRYGRGPLGAAAAGGPAVAA